MIITEDFLLNELPESELIEAWNIFCKNSDWKDRMIYSMQRFDIEFNKKKPSEIVFMIYKCHFVYKDDYFRYSETCLESTSWFMDWIDVDMLANYINGHGMDFKNVESLWKRLL